MDRYGGKNLTHSFVRGGIGELELLSYHTFARWRSLNKLQEARESIPELSWCHDSRRGSLNLYLGM